MDFTEAQQRYQFLEDQRKRGVLTLEQYRIELNQLRVTDTRGRLWMLQEITGQWYVYENGQWIASNPQQSIPPVPSPFDAGPRQTDVITTHQQQTTSVPEKGRSGCKNLVIYMIIWAIIWTVIGVVVYIVAGEDEPSALLGVAAGAVISLVILLFSMNSAWEGTIVDIRVEQVRVNDNFGGWDYQDRRVAFVRRSNGRTKKENAMPAWNVGDRLEKRRGEAWIRHYPAQ